MEGFILILQKGIVTEYHFFAVEAQAKQAAREAVKGSDVDKAIVVPGFMAKSL